MKVKKYLKLQDQFPTLGLDLTWRGSTHNDLEFIRTKVGFIAPRPFEKLDLSAKGSSKSELLKSDYVCVHMERYSETSYQIVMHVEGEKEYSRLRHVDDFVGDGSIQAHIDDLVRWFAGCKAHNGKQLIFERVVKRTVSGSSHCGLSNMNLEIYPFPRHYRFRPVERPALLPPDPATVAYMNNMPMPPIIPGPMRHAVKIPQ